MTLTTVSLVIGALSSGTLIYGCSPASVPPAPVEQQPATVQAAPPPPPQVVVKAPSQASPTGNYEQPLVIDASDLLPASALSGPGFSVQQQAPTNGAMGAYTIVADAGVFHNDAGTYQ